VNILRWPVRPLPGREGEARRLGFLLLTEALVANMLRPIVPLLATSLGSNTAVAGTLLAMQEVTASFVRIPAAVAGVAIGRRLLLLTCFAMGAATCAIFGLAPAVGMLFVAQALWGASTAAFWPAQWAYLTSLMPKGQYARVLGYGMGISGTGVVIGPLISGPIADLWGLRAPFVVVGVWMLVAAGLAWTFPREPRAGGNVGAGLAASARRTIALLRFQPVLASGAGSLLTQVADGVVIVLIPLYLHAAGYSVAFIGAVVTARKIMSVTTRFLFSTFARRFGLPGVVALGLGLDLVGVAGLVWLEGWVPLIVAAMVSGLGSGAGEPAAKTLAVQRTDGEDRDLALGIEGTALVMGRAAGSAGIGILAQALGLVRATLVICIALAALGVAIVWWWFRIDQIKGDSACRPLPTSSRTS
jgi:predicted MFS family arabinose efflux permease